MKRVAAFLVVLLFWPADSVSAARQILRTEPAAVRVTGTLRIERHYGPPGYGDDPRHDELVKVLILYLDRPVKVVGNPKDELNSVSYGDVRKMELVFWAEHRLMERIGQRVTIEGTLSEATTGWHYTKVLLAVKSVMPAK